jgi:Na+/H+ antiporter NhaA
VTNNMLEVPESITIFVLMLLFVLLNVVHQLIVGKDLFIVIIIYRANKLYMSRLPEEFTFVFINTFANLLFINNIENSCTMSLPIFLIHEEGMTDKF